MQSGLDFARFYPEIYQAVAGNDFYVYAYCSDGNMRKVDMNPFLAKGGIFEPLRDPQVFRNTLTVIGYTVAWDLNGTRSEEDCIDVDPLYIFDCPIVPDLPDELLYSESTEN
jgi:hypothetical protein